MMRRLGIKLKLAKIGISDLLLWHLSRERPMASSRACERVGGRLWNKAVGAFPNAAVAVGAT